MQNAKKWSILFTAALEFESRALMERLPGTPSTPFPQMPELLFWPELNLGLWRLGMGKPQPQKLRQVFEQIQPEALVHFGLCGALNPSLPIGAIAGIQKLIALEGEHLTPVIELPSNSIIRTTEEPAYTLLSVVHPVLSSRRRQWLFEKSGADVVDMESYWVVEAAQQIGLPCTVVKVVSDRADEMTWKHIRQHRRMLFQSLQKAVQPFLPYP